LAVKQIFKGDTFELSSTINHYWGKGAKKKKQAGKVSVAAKISNYTVLKALRTQDAFFSSAPNSSNEFFQVYLDFS